MYSSIAGIMEFLFWPGLPSAKRCTSFTVTFMPREAVAVFAGQIVEESSFIEQSISLEMGRYMAYCRSNVAASTLSSTIPNSLLWAYFCFSNTVWQFLLNGSSCSPFGGGQCIKNFFWQTMRRCPSTVMKQIFVI